MRAGGARLCVVAAAALVCVPLRAQPASGPTNSPTDYAQERARVQAERKRLEAAFDAEIVACRERFTVTACVDDVRVRRRAALAEPRARELAIDDLERRERAATRRQAVAQKQRQAAERPVRDPAASAPEAAAVPAHAASAIARVRPHVAPTDAERKADAAHRAEATRERQAQIRAEQERIEARQAERARHKPPAAALPVPGAPSAASH